VVVLQGMNTAGPTIRSVLSPFLVTRAGVLLAGYLGVALFGLEVEAVHFRYSADELHNLIARWDAEWYLQVARDGYQWNGDRWEMQNVAFFPALPLAMRLLAPLLGGDLLYGGLLAALLAFFGALIYLYRFAEPLMGAESARGTVWLLASYPFAVFFSAPYTEAIFLLACVGAFYHAAQGGWRAAALWGVLAGLSRPNGFLLAIPLTVLLWDRWRRQQVRSPGEYLSPLAPVAGVLLFSAYLGHAVGDPLAWYHGQAAWGRQYAGVWWSIYKLVSDQYWLVRGGLRSYTESLPVDFLQASAALFVLLTIWPTFRRFGLPLALFTAVNVLPPLLVGGTMSIGRLTSVMFPVFLLAGAAIPPRHHMTLASGLCMLQALLAAAFFTWRPAY
jgi:Gpi18-like mannosyltransferase